MIKNKKKISFLDYSILFVSLLFFSIVYFYTAIIWPREEKFKTIDRSRMERIDNAQKLYNVLTGDYEEDPARLFALMEAVKDTLDGDEFFEGRLRTQGGMGRSCRRELGGGWEFGRAG